MRTPIGQSSLGMTASPLEAAPTQRAALPGSTAPIRVGGTIAMPRKVYDVAAIYPESMRPSGVTGTVILEVIIERDGKVRSAKVLRSSAAAFGEAAVDAVKQWRYEPVQLNGAAVPIIFTASVVVRP
jgi:protein TonB